jgi:uncharacterized protein YjgD (DUF1641 family)
MSEPIRDVVRAEGPGGDHGGVAGLEGSEEALRHFLELIRVLDERGVLRLVHDLVENNEELVRVALDWLSRPENVRAVQSLRALARSAEGIDPARLESAATAVLRAVDRAASMPDDGRTRGALSVLRQLGEPDANRGLRILLEILRSIGASTREGSDSAR